MLKRHAICSSFLLLILSLTTALAQNEVAKTNKTSAVAITASASGERVRFTAPSATVQIRLEIYNSTGKKIFDNELRGGNVLDWHLQDGQAETLADDSYLCVVTVKSLSGKLTQRIGSVRVDKSTASVEAAATWQMTAPQTEAIGPVEENAALTVLKEGETQTATVIAHNGEEGQLIRGRGALSFRIGDFFSGKDTEQMRLTPEGNLGIGITHPAVKLDVDGLIRASQGIVFPDGSIQYSASRQTLGAQSLPPGQSKKKGGQGEDFRPAAIDVSGTGTTGTIPKWLDGVGALGDSNIFEVSGAIGINGAPSTSFRLDVNGSTRIRGSNPGFNLVGLRPAGNIWAFQTVDDDGRFRLFGQDNVSPGVERLTIGLSTGNVGIGATAPSQLLHLSRGGAGSSTDVQLDNTDTGGVSWAISSVGNISERVGHFEIKRPGISIPFQIAPTGHVGIGATIPQDRLHIATTIVNEGLTITGPPNHTFHVGMQPDGVHVGTSGSDLILTTGNFLTTTVVIDSAQGNMFPGMDGLPTLGKSTRRWATVFAVNGTIQTSDARLKKTVTNLGYGLSQVMQLRPVTFQWKDRTDDRTHLGLIAQEVETIIPEAVERDKDPAVPLGMNYTSLVPVVIKAIQEQQITLSTLKAENAALKARLAGLEKTIDADHAVARQRHSRIRGVKHVVSTGNSTPSQSKAGSGLVAQK